MVYVLTVDQKRSRREPDRVAPILRALEHHLLLRGFERTAGDEFQGVLDDPNVVVDIVLELVRVGGWSIGVGVGPVEEPLPPSTREGRGQAFVFAREAVEAAKRHPGGVAVRGPDLDRAADAEAVLTLLAVLIAPRSSAAWEAIDLVASGATATEAALKLGVSRQAVGQRLAAGHWREERQARPAAARLLRRAAEPSAQRPTARAERGAGLAHVPWLLNGDDAMRRNGARGPDRRQVNR